MSRFLIAVTLFVIMALPTMAQEPEPEPVPVEKGAPEKVTLESPIMQSTGIVDLVVQDSCFDWRHGIVTIRYGEPGENGRSMEIKQYTSQDGRTLLETVNGGNFSETSMNTMLLKKLQTDKVLGTGTIGTTE